MEMSLALNRTELDEWLADVVEDAIARGGKALPVHTAAIGANGAFVVEQWTAAGPSRMSRDVIRAHVPGGVIGLPIKLMVIDQRGIGAAIVLEQPPGPVDLCLARARAPAPSQ